MPFGSSPYGSALGITLDAPAVETRSTLSSSRLIDPRGRYVINAEGGFGPMDDIAQCVRVLVAYARPVGGLIFDRELRSVEQSIRDVLRPLTQGEEPKIKLTAVTATDDGKQTVQVKIVYTNLLTGTLNTVDT